jgi:hypothetical protein
MKLSEARALRAKLASAVQAIPKNSDKIYDAFILFEEWQAGKFYAANTKLRYKSRLYSVQQAHTSQADWTPDAVPAIYEVIPNANEDGTQEKPIAYNVGMRVFNGLYYTEDEVLYVCTRDSGIPLFNALADLEGLYMERVVSE